MVAKSDRTSNPPRDVRCPRCESQLQRRKTGSFGCATCISIWRLHRGRLVSAATVIPDRRDDRQRVLFIGEGWV